MDELEEYLKERRSLERYGQLARLKWMFENSPTQELFVFPGGLHSKRAFEEARNSYLYGLFMGTVLLCLSFVEQTLAAKIYARGENRASSWSLAVLLRRGRDRGLITNVFYNRLEKSRKIRNSFAHFRPPLHEERLSVRSLTFGSEISLVIEKDARELLSTVFALMETHLFQPG